MKFLDPIENLIRRFRHKPDDNAELVIRLKGELERLKSNQKDKEAQILRAALEKLFSEASSPLSQLILQLHIIEHESSSLTSADIAPHVKRLVDTFRQNGLTVLGEPNQIQPFDPNKHESIQQDFAPTPNTAVKICFPGIGFQDLVLRKAAIIAAENAQ